MPTDALSQIKELEARIQQLRSSQLTELKERLQEARRTVACLEAELAKVAGTVILGPSKIRRERTNSEDIRATILKALSSAPTGLRPKEISDATGLSYQTVVMFLKNNGKDFKFTGAVRSKRYFLK